MRLQWGVDFPSKYRWGYDGGTKLAGTRTPEQQPQTLPVQHFSPEENQTKINHQYNLSTITERTSSNDSQSDAYDSHKLSAESQRFNRDGNRPSTGSAANGIGTGYSGVTSLSGPSPVQQVIGALQAPESIMQQHEQQRRRVEDIVYKYKMSLKKYQIYSYIDI